MNTMKKVEWIPFKDQLYFFNTTSWRGHIGASTNCQKMNGHLAIVNSKETENFFDDYIEKYQLEPMIPCLWIGLKKTKEKWIWPGNSSLSYENWFQREPNELGTEECVNKRIRNPYNVQKPWFNDYCDPAGPECGFICQKANQAKQTKTSTTGTSLLPIFIPVLICVAVIVTILLILYCRKQKHKSKTTNTQPNNRMARETVRDGNGSAIDLDMSSFTTNNELSPQSDALSQHHYYESVEVEGDLLFAHDDLMPKESRRESNYRMNSRSRQAENESEENYDILDLESSPARNMTTRV